MVIGTESLPELFWKSVEGRGGHTAMMSVNSERRLTYRRLAGLSQAVLEPLQHMPAGARVAVVCDDKLLTAAAALGILSAGFVFIPIDARSSDALNVIFTTVEPHAVLYQGGVLSDDTIAAVASKHGTLSWQSVDPALCDTDHSFSTPALSLDPEAPAVMLLTSGTTAARKAVCLSLRAFTAPAYSINHAMGYDQDRIEYVCGNLDHAFALGRMRNILAAGATMVVDEGPLMAKKILSALSATGADVLSSPASGVLILLHQHQEAFAEFSGQLSAIKLASQAVPLASKEALLSLFPSTAIFQNYGLSEAQRCTLLALHREPNALDSSGRPVAGVELGIRDRDSLEELPCGEAGAVCVKGPHVMSAYWNMPDRTDQAFHKGWLVTDDLGYLTSEGHLVVIGRADEVINSGGEKYTPDEFEQPLRDHLTDLPFTVCAMNDPQGILGEVPVLCVEAGKGNELSKWAAWPARRIALLKAKVGPLPKYAYQMDVLPRTTTGKVQRKKLTQILNEQTQ